MAAQQQPAWRVAAGRSHLSVVGVLSARCTVPPPTAIATSRRYDSATVNLPAAVCEVTVVVAAVVVLPAAAAVLLRVWVWGGTSWARVEYMDVGRLGFGKQGRGCQGYLCRVILWLGGTDT